jgi:hypothetical protein
MARPAFLQVFTRSDKLEILTVYLDEACTEDQFSKEVANLAASSLYAPKQLIKLAATPRQI